MNCDERVRSYFASIPVPTLPAESIVLSGLFPSAKRYLERHGCVILEQDEAVTVKYPVGTTRTEVLPRTMCERYLVVLPDGTELQKSHPFLLDGDNCLWVPQEALRERE